MAQYSSYILVCGGTGCRASQSELILQNLKEAVERQGLQETVQVIRTGCFGFCEKGPVVKMVPDNTFYVQVKPTDAVDIVREHLVKDARWNGFFTSIPKQRSWCRTLNISIFTKSNSVSLSEIVVSSIPKYRRIYCP